MKLYFIFSFLFTTIIFAQEKPNVIKVTSLGYNNAIIENEFKKEINLKFKTQFIIAESDDFDIKRQDVFDKILNKKIGHYSEGWIKIDKEGKYRIKYDFYNNKINILKNKEVVMIGRLKFESNNLSEIVFENSHFISQYSNIIQTWASLTTVNKLYGYDLDKKVKDAAVLGAVLGVLF